MTAPPVPVDLKNPVIAGVLAFLCPGAGHLYQKRFFKAFVFAACVWGSWWTGMAMSDWKALQAPAKGHMQTAVVLKFAGQGGVGLPAVWSVYQAKRYYDKDNTPLDTIPGPQEYAFTGQADLREPTGNRSKPVTGTLSLIPSENDYGPAIAGQFSGTLDGQPVILKLRPNLQLDQPVRCQREQPVACSLEDEQGQNIGELRGTIPRSVFNWFACPLSPNEEVEWHRDRGKYQELAMVFVWVAGLMNLLAVWDAFEGPAYGINDDEPVPTPAG